MKGLHARYSAPISTARPRASRLIEAYSPKLGRRIQLFDHKDAARAYWSFELIKWLTSSAIDARWNLTVGNLPLRTAEKDTPEFATYVKDYPGGEVMFANLANATKPRPTVSGYVELSRYVGQAIAKTLQGQSTAKAALDDAAQKADQALAGG